MAVAIQISPNESLYIKDPQGSSTGRKLLLHAIPLMHAIGFEKFTFKKLAEKMGASEITVYRYFENKHKLLLYLLSWYWEWVKYSIVFNTRNLQSPSEKLKLAIRTLVESNKRNPLVEYIDEEKLHALVVEESEKAYHTKYVDEENKQGLFLTLKSLKSELSGIISEVNPEYVYSSSLSSTILKMSTSLRFYAQHLPSMTEVKGSEEMDEQLIQFLDHLAFRSIG